MQPHRRTEFTRRHPGTSVRYGWQEMLRKDVEPRRLKKSRVLIQPFGQTTCGRFPREPPQSDVEPRGVRPNGRVRRATFRMVHGFPRKLKPPFTGRAFPNTFSHLVPISGRGPDFHGGKLTCRHVRLWSGVGVSSTLCGTC